MTLLVLSGRDLPGLLPYPEVVAVMRQALAAHASGEAYQPLRTMIKPPGAEGLMALMPCYVPPPAGEPGSEPGEPTAEPGYGLKAICISPGNPALGQDSHQGVVLVSSARTGEPLALANGSALTEIRTAAVSALATSLLARPDATEVAVIGTGVQARAHIQALAACRELTGIRVAGHEPSRARRFAADVAGLVTVPVAASDSVAGALAGAGSVVTATTSAAPVLRRDWLAPGTHINAVGACLPAAREIDAATMAAAALFVDSRESALNEAGDVLLAMADGAIGAADIRAELGEVITGAALGREDDQQITLFESLGLAVEDFAAVAHAYRKALAAGVGTPVDF
jgi:ornithine cyclodeaminase/alanine dehydrogenase-like protein (mu-crystallin family)